MIGKSWENACSNASLASNRPKNLGRLFFWGLVGMSGGTNCTVYLCPEMVVYPLTFKEWPRNKRDMVSPPAVGYISKWLIVAHGTNHDADVFDT